MVGYRMIAWMLCLRLRLSSLACPYIPIPFISIGVQGKPYESCRSGGKWRHSYASGNGSLLKSHISLANLVTPVRNIALVSLWIPWINCQRILKIQLPRTVCFSARWNPTVHWCISITTRLFPSRNYKNIEFPFFLLCSKGSVYEDRLSFLKPNGFLIL